MTESKKKSRKIKQLMRRYDKAPCHNTARQTDWRRAAGFVNEKANSTQGDRKREHGHPADYPICAWDGGEYVQQRVRVPTAEQAEQHGVRGWTKRPETLRTEHGKGPAHRAHLGEGMGVLDEASYLDTGAVSAVVTQVPPKTPQHHGYRSVAHAVREGQGKQGP